jgi:hypothetical protein
MADMKRQDIAEAPEQLLIGTTWLPALLRTPPAGQGSAEHQQAEAVTEAKDTNSCARLHDPAPSTGCISTKSRTVCT